MRLDLSKNQIRDCLLEKLDFSDAEIDGDFYLNDGMQSAIVSGAKKPAAVLIGLIERENVVNVILTNCFSGG